MYMYKLQKYHRQRLSRKKYTGLSLSRKSYRRRCHAKTNRCHNRSSTRRFRKYTIKKGNNRVRKNVQRGGLWSLSKGIQIVNTVYEPELSGTDRLKQYVQRSQQENDRNQEIVNALKNYIKKQYPLSFGRTNAVLTFSGETNAQVTKLDSHNKRKFTAAENRNEYIYIFEQSNGNNTIYYIVRCAQKNGCYPRFTTFSQLTDSVVEVDSVYGNILEGISRPLKGMEREVLRLIVDKIEGEHQTIFKKSDDNSVKYRIITRPQNTANSVQSSKHSFLYDNSSRTYSSRTDSSSTDSSLTSNE